MTPILFPTDFSNNASKVIKYVLQHLDSSKVRAVIYHSIEPPRASGGAFVSIERQMTEIALEQMDACIKDVKSYYKGDLEGLCRAGFMDDNINAAMKAQGAKLCVMCSKGESDVESKVFGSNAEHCLRKAQYPIWVLPTELPTRINKLIYATEDGYLNGKVFLEEFIGLFHREDVELAKLRVLTSPEQANETIREESLGGNIVGLYTKHSDKAIKGINEWVEEHKETDIIILNTYHTKWYDALLNNSTTQKLAASLKISILSLPNLK